MSQKKIKDGESTQDASYDHVLKYTGVFGGVQGLKILINIVRTKLTSIFLGSYGMGLNAIYQKVAEMVNSVSNFGLSFSSLRTLSELYENGSDEEVGRFVTIIRTWCAWTAILGFAICFLCAPLFSHFFFPSGASHMKELLLVSLFVASLPIEAGECSILKGLRRLKCVALVEGGIALSTFLLTVPIYYLFGVYGVIFSLVCCGWANAGLHLYFSCRIVPYRLRLFSREIFKAGLPLLKVGIPYVLAAVAGSATSVLVFRTISDPKQIGLYQAGYNLMVTYAGMVFVAIEADYFPRLSAVNHDRIRMNQVINQQIDVCVSLMTPLLIVMALMMPRIMNTLYASEFKAIAPMAVLAVFYMFFKAITLPVAYSTLAKGDSVVYLILELLYDGAYILLIYFGYHIGSGYSYMFDGVQSAGLSGTGVALSLAGLFDLLLVGGFTYFYYGFRLRRHTMVLILLETIVLAAVMPYCLVGGMRLMKYSVGLVSLSVSLALAWRFIGRRMDLVSRLTNRFHIHKKS